jgi:hypothetical protein
VIRRQIVAGALTLVVIAVMGLLYLEAVAQAHATRGAWMLTRDVSAGAVLEDHDVKRVRIPDAGDQFAVLDESPVHRRMAHRMGAQTLIAADDLMAQDTVQVPVSVRVAPAVAAGDTLDIYAVVGTRTVLVGRRLVVVAPGNPLTLLVPAGDEPNWVALLANNVSLFATKSSGVGVPGSAGTAVGEAIANLAGAAESGPILTVPTPPPSPAPSPSPPGPRASPSPVTR